MKINFNIDISLEETIALMDIINKQQVSSSPPPPIVASTNPLTKKRAKVKSDVTDTEIDNYSFPDFKLARHIYYDIIGETENQVKVGGHWFMKTFFDISDKNT